jgi:hypothetical protein
MSNNRRQNLPAKRSERSVATVSITAIRGALGAAGVEFIEEMAVVRVFGSGRL